MEDHFSPRRNSINLPLNSPDYGLQEPFFHSSGTRGLGATAPTKNNLARDLSEDPECVGYIIAIGARMKAEVFKKLRADAATYGNEHGVDAYLDMEEMEKSQTHVGGMRVRLFITRDMDDGQPPRRWEQIPDYAPDVQDLLERIKKDIRSGAAALYKSS